MNHQYAELATNLRLVHSATVDGVVRVVYVTDSGDYIAGVCEADGSPTLDPASLTRDREQAIRWGRG